MKVVVLGATSGIAVEVERICAGRGHSLGLVARRSDEVSEIKRDLIVRGAPKVETMVVDLSAPASYDGTLQEIAARLGGIDVLLIAYGILGDQARAIIDLNHARAILDTDFTSAASWLLAAAKVVNRDGCIVVISSVAGDRGRKSNFVYGAAKGGLTLLAQGLAHELAESGPRVVVIKPGTVVTPMTVGLKRSGPLWADAKEIARIIVRSIDANHGPIVYAPWFWRWIMLIVRLVPASIFHKTKL